MPIVVILLFRLHPLLFSFIFFYLIEMKVTRHEAGNELLVAATDKMEIFDGQDKPCIDPSLETSAEQL